MKSIRQLLRQPLKTIIGVIMMTLGVLALCVGIGQIYTAKTTAETLEKSFDTVGIMAGMTITTEKGFTFALTPEPGEEAAQWVTDAAQEYPNIIKKVSRTGLASAYIQNLTPVSYYDAEYSDRSVGYTALIASMVRPEDSPRACAMFEITLEEIGEPQTWTLSFATEAEKNSWEFQDYQDWLLYKNNLTKETVTTGYGVELTGKITRVLSLEDGVKDPTGMWLRFSYTVKTAEELEAFLSDLELGSRYLVYGTNYYDGDWSLRLFYEIDEWDFSALRLLTEEEKELWEKNSDRTDMYAVYGARTFTESQYRRINAVSLTVRSSPYASIKYEDIRDEVGNLLEIREVTDRVITDENGNSVTVSVEEYSEYYRMPSIVKLTGSAEEFLDSEAGAEWKTALEQAEVNHHAFAVLGVDDLGYVAQFATEEAQIVEGCEFTDEELESGARVCIISQELASANGLTVGDTIRPNFFNADVNLPYSVSLEKNQGLINPSAGFYFSSTPLLGETEYTVVGIYRSNDPWAYVTTAENHYAFTPNTIFVPTASISAKMQYSGLMQFQTVVLHNGHMDDFSELMNQAGYGGSYLLFDQGYSVIAGNFSDYEAQSKQVMQVCTTACAVISLLYLLLYPGSQRKTMRLMENLGVPAKQRRSHVFTGSLALLIPASVIGAVAGFEFWEKINAKLKLSTGLLVDMQLEGAVLVIVALAQLIVMAALSALIAALQARPHKLGKGR